MIKEKGMELTVEDRLYMQEALALAQKAFDMGEVPVGCAVVCRGAIVGRGYNRRETGKNALFHAEVEAIRQACAALGNWRLENCSIYVTLEPCPMCTGAIINSRIPTVVFGAREALSGSCGSVIDLFSENYGHRPAVFGGVLAEDCAALLRDFFQGKR